MSDAEIASIGRALAEALARAAYERDIPSKREVSRVQTELCQAVRKEMADKSGTS